MPLREFYPDEVTSEEWRAALLRLGKGGPLTVSLVSDGGPWAMHDMPCPVCLDNKAVVRLGEGGFGPCWPCTELGWDLVRRRPRWWRKRFRRRDGVAG